MRRVPDEENAATTTTTTRERECGIFSFFFFGANNEYKNQHLFFGVKCENVLKAFAYGHRQSLPLSSSKQTEKTCRPKQNNKLHPKMVALIKLIILGPLPYMYNVYMRARCSICKICTGIGMRHETVAESPCSAHILQFMNLHEFFAGGGSASTAMV